MKTVTIVYVCKSCKLRFEIGAHEKRRKKGDARAFCRCCARDIVVGETCYWGSESVVKSELAKARARGTVRPKSRRLAAARHNRKLRRATELNRESDRISAALKKETDELQARSAVELEKKLAGDTPDLAVVNAIKTRALQIQDEATKSNALCTVVKEELEKVGILWEVAYRRE